MKRILITTLLFSALLSAANTIHAQDGEGRQKIESAKIAYITNRLNLNSEQATQFWPIYNEYSARKQDLNRKIRQRSVPPGAADQDAMNNLREINAAKQKIADLDQEYMPRFLKVITPGQLLELQNAERTFNKMLLDRLNKDR